MAEPVPVQAGWAIWSKHPGTRDDYSVLASSAGPLSPAEFTRVLMHFAPGNPPAESGTAASLPWVMLSRVGLAEQAYLGISVQVPTDSVDGTGRPISRTSYICIPYEDVARIPVSCRGLSEALTSAHLPVEGGAPASLTIRPLNSEELARAVVEFGPDAVATTAALLLSGPVTITGPDLPDTETRLRFLDAVAALLPYGYRASYTATTWSDTAASGQRFRLVFAHRARDEASRVVWRSPAPVAAPGPARDYLTYLQRVAGGSAVDVTGLASLIDHLSRDTQPRKFEQPEQAVASLGNFFRAAVVGETIDLGRASPADIRLLFAQGQDGQLSPDRQRKALGHLIIAADAQDWGLISQRFDAIAGAGPRGLLPDITQTCRRLLWSTASKDLVGGYLRLVTPYGLADELLAQLVAPPESPEDLARGLDMAATLLAGSVMDSPASYPWTRQALGRNPAAGPALLAHLCASRKLAVSIAVEWLEPVLDRILPPFNAVLGDTADDGAGVTPEPVSAPVIDELSRDGGQLSVWYLLRAASYLGRLRLVLPGLAAWLAWQNVPPGSPDRRFWQDVAMELTPASAAEAAWLDIALLATGNDPRSLLAGAFAQTQFNRELAAAWGELTAQFPEADDLLTGTLTGFLGRYPWRAHQADAVADLTASLTSGGARSHLKAVVLDPAEALRHLPPQATVTQIAAACERAYTGGLPAEQAGDALASSGVITSGAQAADVIEQLHQALARTEISYPWQQALARMVAGGACGGQTAVDFATLVVRYAGPEIDHHLQLLHIAASSSIEGAPPAPPALTDADADRLDRASRFLQEIVHDARKRPGGRIARGLMSIAGRKGGGEGAGE